MQHLSTLALNAVQMLLDGRLEDIDLAGLRVAFDAATPEVAASKQAMLLAVAASSPAPGALAALRTHGLVPACGSLPGPRLPKAALDRAHKANAREVVAILHEDLRALCTNPQAHTPMAHALWEWQQASPAIRNAIRALGLRPAAAGQAQPFRPRLRAWACPHWNRLRAAHALLAG